MTWGWAELQVRRDAWHLETNTETVFQIYNRTDRSSILRRLEHATLGRETNRKTVWAGYSSRFSTKRHCSLFSVTSNVRIWTVLQGSLDGNCHLLHACIFSDSRGSVKNHIPMFLPLYVENKPVSTYSASCFPSSHRKKNTNEKDWNRASQLASHVAHVFRENISITVTSLFGPLMGGIYSSKCEMPARLERHKNTFPRIMRSGKNNTASLVTRKVYEAYTTALCLVFKFSLMVIPNKSQTTPKSLSKVAWWLLSLDHYASGIKLK